MKTYSSTLRTMWLLFVAYQLGLIMRTEAQTSDICTTSITNRAPENSDIKVLCGTEYVDLSIYLCPIYNARYNESLMSLNGELNKPECKGTPKFNVDPPVLHFRFPINHTALADCGINYEIVNQQGTGHFHEFSTIHVLNIFGSVSSVDPSLSMISYQPHILYKFSCQYPMQYFLNNTQLAVSGVSLAINGNNGSFFSTLRMYLFADEEHQQILAIPEDGLNLKTKIYVAVTASNLTDRFHVLLDRCYATTTPFPEKQKSYDLFVGCNHDPQTTVDKNGEAQEAHFSFEAFRFVDHKNLSVSTFYLHCITRLCEKVTCKHLLDDCTNKRRKREVDDVSESATVTSPPITVGLQSSADAETSVAYSGKQHENDYSSPVVAVIICIVVLAIFVVAMGLFFIFLVRRRKPLLQ